MKRFICMLMVAICLLTMFTSQVSAENYHDFVQVTGFEENVDYIQLMKEAALDGGKYALQMGRIYEQQRNLKIRTLKLDYEQTSYFSSYSTGAEILEAMDSVNQKDWWDEEDLDLLSRLVMAEMGCDWMPDWVQQLTATVAINRWKSEKFPDTLYEVVYQPGQYGPASSGAIRNTPTQKVKRNCETALKQWPNLYPSNIYSQDGVTHGETYKSYYDSILGTTTFFCYG